VKKLNTDYFNVEESIKIAKSYTADLDIETPEQKLLAPKLELGIIVYLITKGMEKIAQDYIVAAMREQGNYLIDTDDLDVDLDHFLTDQFRDFKVALHELRELQIASGGKNVAELIDLSYAAYFGQKIMTRSITRVGSQHPADR
jgi:hypothetical protein